MHTTCYTVHDVWAMLEKVPDPEVPVLSVVDLGVVRHVELEDHYGGQHAIITITPTYSGCPAMDMISAGIRMELLMQGIAFVAIVQQLAPAWTTDWMSEAGRQKLSAYGIAPPAGRVAALLAGTLQEDKGIACPHCGSIHTDQISHFGSTACKALHKCHDCLEPFDYFKCH